MVKKLVYLFLISIPVLLLNQNIRNNRMDISYSLQLQDPKNELSSPNLWTKLFRLVSHNSNPAFITPQGIDATRDLLAVADAGAGGVHILNFKANKYNFINLSGDIKGTPIDVAIVKNTVLVSTSGDKEILEYDYMGEQIRSILPKYEIKRISGIDYYAPYIFLTDTPSHTVLCIDFEGNVIFNIGGRGSTEGRLNFPTFVYVSAGGELYITDTMNFRVQVFDLKGNWKRTIGGRGITQGTFNRPKGISVDDNGNLFVVDNSFDNVQIFSLDGEFMQHFGSTGSDPGQFEMPTDIAIAGKNIYISDTMNKRIQVFEISYGN